MNRLDRSRLALESGRSIDTVRRVYRGIGNAYSRASITRAAEKLGLPAPPSDGRTAFERLLRDFIRGEIDRSSVRSVARRLGTNHLKMIVFLAEDGRFCTGDDCREIEARAAEVGWPPSPEIVAARDANGAKWTRFLAGLKDTNA